MRYNGGWNGSSCPQTGTNVKIADSAFNVNSNNLEYNEYIQSDGTSSTIKTVVEQWYTNNIENSPLNANNDLTNKIANVPYCADKSNETISGNYTWYGAANRLLDISTIDPKIVSQPIFKCIDIEHKHTVSGDLWNGDGRLDKPIGLITADEVSYAGGIWTTTTNTLYYLYTNSSYWTISPVLGYYGAAHTFTTDGDLHNAYVNYTRSVLPVISLKANTLVSSGNGSYTQPYIVGN